MPRPRHTVSRLRLALGTLVSLEAGAPDTATAESAITAAYAAVLKVERLMHPHRSGSDLTRLAQAPPGTLLTVDPWTWEVLSLSRNLHQLSEGSFDPCVNVPPGRMTDIELLEGHQVRTHAPVQVDLGGVAKGYAVDRALEAMRLAGCDAGLVNAGGDLAVFGAESRTLFCRSASGAMTAVELTDSALASSDTGNPTRPMEHRGYYHGTDREQPISGRVAVIAPSAALADGLTKCLLAIDAARSGLLVHALGARRVF